MLAPFDHSPDIAGLVDIGAAAFAQIAKALYSGGQHALLHGSIVASTDCLLSAGRAIAARGIAPMPPRVGCTTEAEPCLPPVRVHTGPEGQGEFRPAPSGFRQLPCDFATHRHRNVHQGGSHAGKTRDRPHFTLRVRHCGAIRWNFGSASSTNGPATAARSTALPNASRCSWNSLPGTLPPFSALSFREPGPSRSSTSAHACVSAIAGHDASRRNTAAASEILLGKGSRLRAAAA